MSALASAVLLALALQAPPTKSYKIDSLGLSFKYPASWSVSRSRIQTVFTLPASHGKVAKVQVFDTIFRQSTDVWQNLQAEANNTLKRPIDKQWEETLLDVPLLLTRIKYNEKGQDQVGLVGLLYTATDRKFNFRLTAPAAIADEAEQAWRETLLSLRTASGDLPRTDYPNRPPDPKKPVKPENTGTPTVLKAATPAPPKAKRAHIVAPFAQGEHKYKAYLPKGWSLGIAGDKATLKTNGLHGQVVLQIREGGLEDAIPELNKCATDTLTRFTTVSLRVEQNPAYNQAAVKVASIRRNGACPDGELTLMHAFGVGDYLYWLITYEGKGKDAWNHDHKHISELLDALSVEPAK